VIEDAHVLRERTDDEVDVQACEFFRRDCCARLHQHFEPETESPGVQLFVETRTVAAPQVAIEDGRQLRGRRQRHDLAAVFESATLDDPMKEFRLEPRDRLRKVRRVQNALEQTALVRGLSLDEARAPAATGRAIGSPHGTGDDTGPGAQETVLKSCRR